ncbi:MAG: acetylornithine deacetylase [Actinomycetaceae bacterium]|nr:acetylornithine deacetylase [Actinomycetaceae bacterium]
MSEIGQVPLNGSDSSRATTPEHGNSTGFPTASERVTSTSIPETPRAFIEALVAMDTTSAKSNLAAIDLLEAAFAAAGARIHRIDAADGLHASLFATFPAADGTVDGGVMVAGHTDCVPVDGQDWTSDPFTPTERDGRLYGRGTADMKAYLGIIAALAPQIGATKLSHPLHVAATWDEEVASMRGAVALVAELEKLGIHPQIALVGEPTSMYAIGAHKSMNVMTLTFRGLASHSSLPVRGLNAIRYAAEFITWYHSEIIDRFRSDGPFDEGFLVPWSTGGVNIVRGGTAVNTVADQAYLELDFRTLPEVDAQEIHRRVVEKARELDVRMKADAPAESAGDAAAVGVEVQTIGMVTGLASGPTSAAARYAVSLGALATDDKVTYGTEAGAYEAAGMSAVVVGPGDIAQAHGPDEYIELAQIEEAERFFQRLIADLAQ